MVSPESLLQALAPLAQTVAGLDLADPPGAERALRSAHPDLGALEAALREAQGAGWLCPKVATPTLTFGRLAKAAEPTAGMSIDVVDIAGVGAEHTHPNGEVSLCIALGGDPLFDGRPPGWVVLPPGSHHAPTVEGGRMLIVYFQPQGAVVWGPRA
jgi:hypothetical protein